MMSLAVSDLPRLLFCCFDVVPGPSASSRRLTEYVKGLSERFQVVVLSVKTPDHPHIEKYHGARLLRVPVGAGDLTARAETFDRAVRRQLESEDYVLVHFFDPFGGYALAEKRAELGYKLVYDACVFPSMELTFDSPDGPPNRRLIAKSRRQELFCLMNSDAVIVGNPLTRDWVSTVGVERERVQVLLAPVDLAPYTPEAMGLPDGRPLRLLHLGSLSGSHGLLTLLEGMALAGTLGGPLSRVHLTVVGPPNPEWRARLEHQAAKVGLIGQLTFASPVTHDELHRVLATTDAGALTLEDVERNRVVGSPLSRLGEYLAAGRPVIAADVPSARQLVPPEAALWYRPADPRSLADALVALASDIPTRLELGVAARAAAVKWDAAKIRADLVVLYSAVTGQPARRALDEDGEAFDSNDVTQLGPRMAEPAEVTQLGAAPPRRDHVSTDPTIAPPTPAEEPAPALAAPPAPVPAAAPPVEGRTVEAPVFQLPRFIPLVTSVVPEPSSLDAPEARPPPGPRESAPLFQSAPEEPPPPVSPRPLPPLLPPPLPTPRPSRPPAVPAAAAEVAGSFTPPPFPRSALSSPTPLPKSLRSTPPTLPLGLSPIPFQPPRAPQLASTPQAPTSTLGIGPIPLPPISPPARARSAQLPTVTRATPLFVPSPTPGDRLLDALVEEPLQVLDDEVHSVDAGEPDAAEESELMASDDIHAVDTDASPPASAIDPWLAQLVHGYCPPGSHLFDRPVPPTTMPGRDG